MNLVWLTALGVGGATIIGSVIGFLFKSISHRFSDIVLSFAAGVMLSAAVLGLILPSVEYGGTYGLLYTIPGIFAGALALFCHRSNVVRLLKGQENRLDFKKISSLHSKMKLK